MPILVLSGDGYRRRDRVGRSLLEPTPEWPWSTDSAGVRP
jgi:hypothetical protein